MESRVPEIYFRWSICAGRRSGIWSDTQGKPYIWSGVASGQWSRKCKRNSKVVIKLENYPYMEYGYIEGYVSSISLVTQTQKTGEKTIETYLINVELPNGLTTNYEETLDFKYELGGTADIIVKDRRLIERLFDNLRYRTK